MSKLFILLARAISKDRCGPFYARCKLNCISPLEVPLTGTKLFLTVCA
jgi:hypothetical protein